MQVLKDSELKDMQEVKKAVSLDTFESLSLAYVEDDAIDLDDENFLEKVKSLDFAV